MQVSPTEICMICVWMGKRDAPWSATALPSLPHHVLWEKPRESPVKTYISVAITMYRDLQTSTITWKYVKIYENYRFPMKSDRVFPDRFANILHITVRRKKVSISPKDLELRKASGPETTSSVTVSGWKALHWVQCRLPGLVEAFFRGNLKIHFRKAPSKQREKILQCQKIGMNDICLILLGDDIYTCACIYIYIYIYVHIIYVYI